jgi:hypothetical protein
MQQISDLLKLFESIQSPKVERVFLSGVINKSLGIDIKDDQVKINRDVVILKVNQVQKNLIFISKNKVLSDLNNSYKECFLRDIMFV